MVFSVKPGNSLILSVWNNLTFLSSFLWLDWMAGLKVSLITGASILPSNMLFKIDLIPPCVIAMVH